MAEKRYITHLIIKGIPSSGMRKLFFYTIKGDIAKSEKYYIGTGNNSFSTEEMRKQIQSGKVVMLPQRIELEDKKGLWVNSDGKVFYADLKHPHKDEFKKDLNFAPRELKKSSIEYQSIKAKGLPKVSFSHKLFLF